VINMKPTGRFDPLRVGLVTADGAAILLRLDHGFVLLDREAIPAEILSEIHLAPRWVGFYPARDILALSNLGLRSVEARGCSPVG